MPRTNRKKFILIVLLQCCLSFLDLIGVFMIGFIGIISATGIQSKSPSSTIIEFTSLFNLERVSFQNQVAILATLASFTLILRSMLSIITTRRILRFLSLQAADLTVELHSQVLATEIQFINRFPRQRLLFSISGGVNSLMLGVLGNLATLISDLALIICIYVGLFVFDTSIALSTLIIFLLIAVYLYFKIHRKVRVLSEINSSLSISGESLIMESFNIFRDIRIKNLSSYYLKKIQDIKFRLATYQAEIHFMPNFSKYILEMSLILGILVFCGIQFFLLNAIEAVSSLSVLLAAGARISPAMMRIQQSFITLNNSIGNAAPTLSLINDLRIQKESDNRSPLLINVSDKYSDFKAEFEFKNVSFKYFNSEKYALKNISLKVEAGEYIGVVGSSGSGKSTFVDVLLGLLTPQGGSVSISGVHADRAVLTWSGAISYVPQDVHIIDGSIFDNVILGYETDNESLDRVHQVLEMVGLSKFVSGQMEGALFQVGEGGRKLSGGEKQRLGIARALYTRPRLLVLDEATSSLDLRTEKELSDTLLGLKGSVTLVVIAHRLTTIQIADRVAFFKNGAIQDIGTFNDLKSNNADFRDLVQKSQLRY